MVVNNRGVGPAHGVEPSPYESNCTLSLTHHLRRKFSPFCVFDLAGFETRLRKIASLFPSFPVTQTLFKPNGLTHPSILRAVRNSGVSFDVIDRRELRKCEDDEPVLQPMLFSNPYKFKKDVRAALISESSEIIFVVDSVDELRIIERQSHDLSCSVSVLIRLTLEATPRGAFGCQATDLHSLVNEAIRMKFQVVGVSLCWDTDGSPCGAEAIKLLFENAETVLDKIRARNSADPALICHVDLDGLEEVFPHVDRCAQGLERCTTDALRFFVSSHDYLVRSSLVIATRVDSVNRQHGECNIRLISGEAEGQCEEHELELHERTLTPFFFDADCGSWFALHKQCTDSHEEEKEEEAVRVEFSRFPGGLAQRARLRQSASISECLGAGAWLFWRLDSASVDLRWRASLPMLIHDRSSGQQAAAPNGAACLAKNSYFLSTAEVAAS